MHQTRRSIFRTCSCMAVSSLLCATAFHPASAQAPQRPASPASGGASRPQYSLPAPSEALLTEIESIYKDIHANPELSMQERRTAGIAAEWLRKQGYEVAEAVGKVGVVGMLRNGDGATVLLRADMDALPMQENTGLPYASSKTGIDPANGQETAIAHSCGHDMHVAWLMAAARLLSENRDKWRGTVLTVFQPGEETAEGARAMVDDGLVRRFPKPDVVLGQHVMPLAAGQVAISSGTILSRSDSLEVMLFGRGGHGSSPETTVDPVVMAASAVTQLQTVVSREIGMTDQAVITVGALQAGSSANIIPDHALLRLNIRTFDDQVRERVLSSVRRIITQQAELSRSPKPPTFKTLSTFPLTINDEDATRKVAEALRARMGADRVQPASAASASEDFTVLARAWDVPSVYWLVGGTDPDTYAKAQKEGRSNDIPSNHSPEFAPVLQPTLRAGIEAMLAAASPWLASGEARR